MSDRIKTWGIVLILAAAVLAGVIVYYVRSRDVPQPSEEKGMEFVQETDPEETYPEEKQPAGIFAEAEETYPEAEEAAVVETDYQFLLVSENDYVVVYKLPERELYEYTDVILDVLPQEVRQEILEEKYLRNEEELYNFLENYTS